MHFLDTDTMTLAHLGHPKVVSRIERVGEQNVATTSSPRSKSFAGDTSTS